MQFFAAFKAVNFFKLYGHLGLFILARFLGNQAKQYIVFPTDMGMQKAGITAGGPDHFCPGLLILRIPQSGRLQHGPDIGVALLVVSDQAAYFASFDG